ncbi:2',3'-cyclic-nucleotide 3'-phosphodiesterase [Schizosaccharomyces cryophilus OY26]|uniref:2',3'-cyclic-nucleotide 3'-phosphodiesterase n=1 Tax=Schizosaccharomyces cryophilus (strain OY26 / ATCC MYA-4695 / CBS 11777 / NBRC 106824 / NRRL Y48691) TaxID=653667 RepID=S9W407_SCHCR|nr:2',3'-cyclic-nucleotide 3'-phosphodiesterase [Schizosaccharomyces cryophilus OY26]EPY53269.1 2',3'-cyclic-nucleotide 3'-phosphodiesterase [Schizosaccharomyces cryophilus OY26]
MQSPKSFPHLEDRTNSPGVVGSSDDYVYAIWIVPAYSSDIEKRYRKFTKWALSHEDEFEDMQLPTAPHVTLARGINLKPGQSFVSVLRHIASKKVSSMDIKFGKLAVGDTYYERVYVQVERTPALNELQTAAYELADDTPDNKIVEPLMPLVYAKSVNHYYGTSDPVETFSSISSVKWENPSFLELVQVNKTTHQGIICDRIELS